MSVRLIFLKSPGSTIPHEHVTRIIRFPDVNLALDVASLRPPIMDLITRFEAVDQSQNQTLWIKSIWDDVMLCPVPHNEWFTNDIEHWSGRSPSLLSPERCNCSHGTLVIYILSFSVVPVWVSCPEIPAGFGNSKELTVGVLEVGLRTSTSWQPVNAVKYWVKQPKA